MSLHLQEGDILILVQNPIGVGVTLSCLHNVLWTSGWILTKFSWIYNWNIAKNWIDLGDLDEIFKITAAGLGSSVGWTSDLWSGDCRFYHCQMLNILWRRLIMKYFLWSFSPFCWFKTPWGWLGHKTSTQTNKQGHSSRKTENSRWWGHLFSLKTLLVVDDFSFFM